MRFEGGDFKIMFSLSLVKGELPDGAVLEVHFQNPIDPATAFTIVVTDLSNDTIYVAGPVTGKPLRVTDFKCQNYWMDVHVYPDATATQELGIHVQWVNSTFCSPK